MVYSQKKEVPPEPELGPGWRKVEVKKDNRVVKTLTKYWNPQGEELSYKDVRKILDNENIQVAEKVETAENNQMTKERKRERFDDVPHQSTSMWERLKIVKTRQKSALEEAAKKRKEKEEELVKMEEEMVEELDKEFEDKMAALVREKQEKRAEIAEKVKAKQERQAQVDQETLAKLEKEHKAEREELMEEIWGHAEELGC